LPSVSPVHPPIDAIRLEHVRRVVCSGLTRDFLFFIDICSLAPAKYSRSTCLTWSYNLQWNSFVLAHCTLCSSRCCVRMPVSVKIYTHVMRLRRRLHCRQQVRQYFVIVHLAPKGVELKEM
jgi:hypothetical protein